MSDSTFDPITLNFIEKGVARLRDEFRGIFSHQTIQRFVDEAIASLAGARVKDFVPMFVNRFARERLRAMAQAQGSIVKEVPEVLFVCVHNAGRSQMAAALLDLHANGRVHVRSAGSTPADQINPAAIDAMAELEIDLREAAPSTRASGMRTGRWTIRLAGASQMCDGSAMTSINAFGFFWRVWCPPKSEPSASTSTRTP